MRTRQDGGRREVIVEAAWRCFLEYGYRKTSLDDVARRAGLSRPLIYLQFANKKELFTTLIVDLVDRQFALAREVARTNLGPRAQLGRLIEVWFLETWTLFSGSPERNELFDEAFRIAPAIEAKYRERTVELLAPLVGGPKQADVFRLATKGLISDRPSLPELRERLDTLADRFVVGAPARL
jgi:AcrR family transcriptional regulator